MRLMHALARGERLSGLMLFALCFLCLCGTPLQAALDPETGKPYRVVVVLRVARHRLLTDIFKDQVERKLGDGLRGALGDLAEVTVVRDHPQLKEIDDRGLQQALDAWRDVTEVKTHFVLIDFVDGQYVIRTRQHDGLTGQASPVVREERTADREFVARTAALLIDRDFGMVGTVVEPLDPQSQTVKIALKGSGLGADLRRWVKKDEVFILAQISKSSAGFRANRVPWTLLQVQDDPHEGVCVGKLFYGYKDPLGSNTPGVLGVRCLKLSTLEQKPLRLRLVQAGDKGLGAPPTLQVQVRRHSFRGSESDQVDTSTNADGYVTTSKLYNHLALVTVLPVGNTKAIAQFPVALLDDNPFVCPVRVNAESNVSLNLSKKLWEQELYTSYLVQSELFKQLKEILGQPGKLTDALKRAQTGHDAVQSDIKNFTQERSELMDMARAQVRGGQIDLADGDRVLAELRKAEDALKKVVEDLERNVRDEQDPKRKELQSQVEQAKLDEKNADFGKALDLYQRALDGGLRSDQLSKHVAELKEAWKIKDDNHKLARAFIYEIWPTLDLVKDKDALPDARKAFGTCKASGDKLTPQKLLKSTVEHAASLQKVLSGLQPDVNVDDQQTAQVIEKVAEELKKLIKDVTAYVQP